MIEEADNFFGLRKKEKATITLKEVEKPVIKSIKEAEIDEEIKNAFNETKERARVLTVRKIKTYRDKVDLPTIEEVNEMSLGTLQNLSNAFNIKYSTNAFLNLFMFSVPKKDDQNWVKLNAQKKLDDANLVLDKFEKTI